MPDLPNNIVSYIVEAVHDPKTQWALLTVCHQMSRFTLPSMYRELSFDSRASPSSYAERDPQYVVSLEKLTLGAESNPNLRFTTSFNYCGFTSRETEHRCVRPLLPFLINLQRLSIPFPYADPETLLFLPPTAKLTHLMLGCTNYSPSFVKFIESHPTLRLISVYRFGARFKSEEIPYDDPIPPTAIPNIISLRCPTGTVKRFGHRPSVTDTCFTAALSEQPLPEETKDMIVKAFPSTRAAYFPVPFDFPGIASLSLRLSRLEYLQLDTYKITTPLDWNLLSASKLKYIRLVDDVTPIGEPEDIARSIFDAIKPMVLLDMNQGEKGRFQRFYRRSKTGFPVHIYTSQWQPWWESVQKDIDDACDHLGGSLAPPSFDDDEVGDKVV